MKEIIRTGGSPCIAISIAFLYNVRLFHSHWNWRENSIPPSNLLAVLLQILHCDMIWLHALNFSDYTIYDADLYLYRLVIVFWIHYGKSKLGFFSKSVEKSLRKAKDFHCVLVFFLFPWQYTIHLTKKAILTLLSTVHMYFNMQLACRRAIGLLKNLINFWSFVSSGPVLAVYIEGPLIACRAQGLSFVVYGSEVAWLIEKWHNLLATRQSLCMVTLLSAYLRTFLPV